MTPRMNKYGDVIFGAAGTASTVTLSTINGYLAFGTGCLTLCILSIRLYREIKNINKPPKD